MKVIKLDRRFKAFQHGYTHAVKCDDWISKEAREIERVLHEMYGWDWDYTKPYKSFSGRRIAGSPTTRYYAVKNETIITQVLLKMEM